MKSQKVEPNITKVIQGNCVQYRFHRKSGKKPFAVHFNTLEEAQAYKAKYNEMEADSNEMKAKLFIDRREREFKSKLAKEELEDKGFPYNLFAVLFGDLKLSAADEQIALDRLSGKPLEYIMSKRLINAYADAVREYFVKGMKLDEMAELHGLTKEGMRQRIVKGIRILKAKPNRDYLRCEGEVEDLVNSAREEAKSQIERLSYEQAKRLADDYEEKHQNTGLDASVLERRFDEAGLSIRTVNALTKASCERVADVVGHTEEELANIRGMGSRSLEETLEFLKSIGVQLKKR